MINPQFVKQLLNKAINQQILTRQLINKIRFFFQFFFGKGKMTKTYLQL